MYASRNLLRTWTSASRRAFGTKTPVTLPSLQYDYGALEPIISGEIMQIHHAKHHQAYVTNFNMALAQLDEAEAKQDVERMIALQVNLLGFYVLA